MIDITPHYTPEQWFALCKGLRIDPYDPTLIDKKAAAELKAREKTQRRGKRKRVQP